MNESIGQQLQNARLERKLTLEEAAHGTHIRLHYLEALERDQRDRMPSAVQGKGFLRLYAGYLGLEVQPLLDAWDGKMEQPPAKPEPPKETPRRRLRWRRDPIVETLPPEGAQQEEEPPESAEETPIEEPVAEHPEPETPAAAATVPELAAEVEAVETAAPEPAPIEPMAENFEDIFTEIGRTLRKQRETLSLKISDVERFTHIRHRYIEALEKGLIDELPSPVQGRGMLNNYARFLDLDTEQMLLRFADGLQARRKEYASATLSQASHSARRKRLTQPTRASSWRRFFTPDMLIGGSLILFLLIFAVYGASQVSAIRQENEAISAGEVTLEPVANIMLTVSPSVEETVTATPIPTVKIDQAGAPPAAVSGSSEEIPVEGQAPASETTGTGSDSVQPPEGSGPLQLYIVANQRAYLKIISDGKEAFNGRVQPGNAYQYSGKEQIELLTGNAAALQVFYNQSDLGTLGKVGEVVSLVFNQQGLLTPTAIFTATPTATVQPTQTIAPTGTARPQPSATITPYIP